MGYDSAAAPRDRFSLRGHVFHEREGELLRLDHRRLTGGPVVGERQFRIDFHPLGTKWGLHGLASSGRPKVQFERLFYHYWNFFISDRAVRKHPESSTRSDEWGESIDRR